MKIRPTETGDTDEGEKEQTWVHLDWSYWCRLGERAGDRVDHPAPPPPPSPFPRGLQQLRHIFNFIAIVAAATTPCCIVPCAATYNDHVLPPAEEPFTGTGPTAAAATL